MLLLREDDRNLLHQSRLLSDPHFLIALQRQWESEWNEEDTQQAFLQLGFAKGLFDARSAVGANWNSEFPDMAVASSSVPLWPFSFGPAEKAIETTANSTLRGFWKSPPLDNNDENNPHHLCQLKRGYVAGWLSELFESDFVLHEDCCQRKQGSNCSFTASTIATDHCESSYAEIRQWVDADQLSPIPTTQSKENEEGSFAQVWGPVMIVPFVGPDEALQAIELIGHDPEAR